MSADPDLETQIRAAVEARDLTVAATIAVRGYGPSVLGYLRTVLGDSDGDEAFAIYCESLWKGLPGFRGESAFRTWSYKLAWGAVQRLRNEPQRRRNCRLESEQLESVVQEVRSTTPVHLRAETAAHVQRIREQLTADEQTLLILRVDRDLPWAEVADVLETNEATLRKRFERTRDKLRELARAAGLLPDPA
ncbi:MAG: sigma-70 family RNA polymerase sigma factor [Myxococcales bacterium]|nr:sigma-70 family RNA polymerase sigma factor [Myxococcales bacterium]